MHLSRGGNDDGSAIAGSLPPFLLIRVTGLAWEMFCVLVLAPILLPTYPFENAICHFGQDTGVIAAGLLLLRMVDPENRTDVPEAFAYKQIIHSTFMGGGLVTALWLPLQKAMGLWPITFLTLSIFLVMLVAWACTIWPSFAEVRANLAQREDKRMRHSASAQGMSESPSERLINPMDLSESHEE